MTKSIWELNVMGGKNPTHTAAFLNSYDSRQFTPEEVAARESAQNASDAGAEVNAPTRLVFQKLFADEEKKDKLMELFDFDKLLEPRLSSFEASKQHRQFALKLKEFLEGDTISALLIRDYNTCGLGGNWKNYGLKDHFGRLVCALNLDDKSDGDASMGGSFGLGKTAYAKSSSINTVIYHSVFEETPESEGASRRLMATGVYPKHDFNGEAYGGFAYFGEEMDGKEAKPFENESAAQIWSELSEIFGIDLLRDNKEHGTDVLILMDSLDLGKIKTAIEDFYFPAIIEGTLLVEFKDEDGSVEFPEVLNRSDLDQFVRLYKKIKLNQECKEETTEVASLQKRSDHKIGQVAFQAAEPDEAASVRNNCIAITRGTGMIINYLKIGSEKYEPAVGVYMADKDVNEYLNASENAAHSEWNHKSRRLEQQFPDLGPGLVKHISSVISSRFTQFQKGLQPDIANTRSENGFLARLLAHALSGSKGDRRPEKNWNNPASIHLTRRSRDEGKTVWRLQITPNEFTPSEGINLKIFPSISLAGDSKKIAIKNMEFTVKDKSGKIIGHGYKPEIKVAFTPGSVVDYNVEFPNPGRKNYVVQCKCLTALEID
jgi:hypothetical protein